jgi:hypothetical protein
MPVDRNVSNTFASGEFDPLLRAREDVAFYYSSAKELENVIVLPQGPVKRREGWRAASVQRGPITEVDISGYTLAAPEGGTAANLTSTDPDTILETTGEIGTATEFVCATIDAGSAVRFSLCDIAAGLTDETSADTITLALQSSDDDSTYTTRAELVVGNQLLERRFAVAPDNDLGTHRYWRIIVDNPDGDDFGTQDVRLYGFKVWQEDGYSQTDAVPGTSRVERISVTVDEEYWALFTANCCDIFNVDGVWQACVATPYTGPQTDEFTHSQSRDTLVTYQKDQPPQIIQRLAGLDTEWRAGDFPFDKIAQFPFADSTSGGENEKQELQFESMTAGNRFVFEFNGEISDEVEWNNTPATRNAEIKAALESLVAIDEVTVTNDGANHIVEFTGPSAKTFFAVIVVDILDGSGTVSISRTQYGVPDREDLWSATRGYPRCGTFFQGRHWMGGFRSAPDVIVGSRIGRFDQFFQDQDPVATSPIIASPDIDEQVTIQNIFPGVQLQIFGSSVELFVDTPVITPDTLSLRVSSRRGTDPNTQPVDVQGGTFFVDRNGTSIREYIFSEAIQNYTAEPITTLGQHLVNRPSQMSLRRQVGTVDPTLIYLTNTGRDAAKRRVPACVMTVDRAQQINALARINTAGHDIKGIACTQGGSVAALVDRPLGGNRWTYLEVADADHMSDHSYEIANPDSDEFTATDGQTVFTYTFTNPTDTRDIAMFTRAEDGEAWSRVEPSTYTLDTGAKTITLDEGATAGHLYVIALRQTSFATGAAELNGVECYVHADGRPVGPHTPSAGSVSIAGDEGFFFHARIGLRMVPRIVLQAYKGRGGTSPTMQKQRIFRALLDLERTSNIAIGTETRRPRAIALSDYDSGTYDLDLEEILFSGTKRTSGIKGWETEPRIVITQTEPGPFLMRSCIYDVRF